jgi:hypothetical protein
MLSCSGRPLADNLMSIPHASTLSAAIMPADLNLMIVRSAKP